MTKTIILIDDNSADNMVHERIIRNAVAHAEISIIDNGHEAVAYLARELLNPETSSQKIVLLDQKMPGLSGLDIIEKLESLVRIDPTQIQIYFLTNDHSRRLEEKARTFESVKKIIRKPLTPQSAAEMFGAAPHNPIAKPHPTP